MKLTEREKAYHDGYKQGQFDEYAKRMGYGQAEKVKAKIDKQKNCPYCHEKDGDHGLKMIKVSSDYQSELVLGEDGWYLWVANPLTFQVMIPINYCPACGRPLGGNEDG